MKRYLLVISILLTFEAAAFGQGYDTSPGAQTGRLPFSSYGGGDIDSISLYNGNLMLDLPLLDLPGRELSTGLRAIYNSQKWQESDFLGETYALYTGGWRLHDLIGDKPKLSTVLIDCDTLNDVGYWDIAAYWVDGFGTKHVYTVDEYVETQGCEDASGAGIVMYPLIGDHTATVSATLSDPPVFQMEFMGGKVIEFTGTYPKVRTANGNYLERGTNGLPRYDTLNRTIGFSTTKGSADPYVETYTVTDAQGNSQTYKFKYEASHQAFNPILLQNEAIADWLIEIELPNGKKYEFKYEAECDFGGSVGVKNSGYLSKIILPSGAYQRYTYGCDGHGGYITSRHVSETGQQGDEEDWSYARSNESWSGTGYIRDVTVTNPDFTKVVHRFNDEGLEFETDWRKADNSSVQKTTRTWNQDSVAGNGQPVNPRLSTIITIRGTKEQKVEMTHDQYQRVTQTDVSDWYPTGGTLVPLMRTTQRYYNQDYGCCPLAAWSLPSISELQRWVVGSSYETVGKTQSFYDEAGSISPPVSGVPQKMTPTQSSRGNVTKIRRWKDASNYLDETFTYDDQGNVVSHTTPGGHTTTISYADSFGSAGNHNSYAFPTATSTPANSGTTLTTSASYNYDTGLLVTSTDERGLVTTREYDDPLSRLKQVTYPGTSPLVETWDYDDDNGIVARRAVIASGVEVGTDTHFDKLYRVVKTVEKDPAGDVTVRTNYDANGRVWQVSEPYRAATQSPLYNATTYDALSRPILVTNSDSTTVQIAYSENTVTVTDEGGKETRRTTNGLGHLTKVEQLNPAEASPSLSTNPLVTRYEYGVAGNLTAVYQHTIQTPTRTFSHNWLGQLLSEWHPESGTTSYTYYPNGNVWTRTRVHYRPGVQDVTSTYSYDYVGRLTQASHSDGTPTVTRTYDQNNYFGLLTTMADGAGSVSYAYKSNANLLASETRTFTGVSGSFAASYDYDKAGRLIETVYPSGRRVAHTYAASGYTVNREATLKTQPNTQTSLTTLATISVSAGTSGQTVSRTLGNGVVETLAFNRRSQLTDIDAVLSSTSLMNMAYSYGTTANTGRVQSRTDILQPEHSVNYTYDALHRLKQATAANASWSVSWGLDSYGNRTTQTPGGLATTVLGSPSMGYINNKNMASSYDDFGNVTNDGVSSYAYNADNQMVSKGGGTVTYGYDGDGRRITKTAGGVTTFYLYGMTGLMSEFTTATGPQQAAAATDRLEYRIAEQTGTAVLLMNSSGLVTENNRVYPYGELWESAVVTTNSDNFTSYNRDSETGFDYAMARYYGSRNGRFMSADPGHVGASLDDPQSWNAYAYVGNDPINKSDPSGAIPCWIPLLGDCEDPGPPPQPPPCLTGFESTCPRVPGNLPGPADDLVDTVGRGLKKVKDVVQPLMQPIACTALAAAKGAVIGGAAGSVIGGAAGAAGGGIVTSPTGPGAVVGAGIGFAGGATIGLAAGMKSGAVVGAVYGVAKCFTPPTIFLAQDGTPSNNRAQNKQFDDAIRQAEKMMGKKLSPDQVRRVHDMISGENMGFGEIVELVVQMFGG